MTAARKLDLVSVEDYLAGELESPVKHEYLGGFVYAMSGARNAHNIIAGNILIAVGSRLHGRPCRPFNSDTKIRIRFPAQTRFYYPDASVSCRPNPQSDSFQDDPSLVVEVLSRSTRRIDEGEKKDAYLTIPSLSVYLLVEQEFPGATALRRTEQGFVPEVYKGLDAVIPLPEIGVELPLLEVYESVNLLPEAAEEGSDGLR
jgi:Uma2 family endonuclease